MLYSVGAICAPYAQMILAPSGRAGACLGRRGSVSPATEITQSEVLRAARMRIVFTNGSKLLSCLHAGDSSFGRRRVGHAEEHPRTLVATTSESTHIAVLCVCLAHCIHVFGQSYWCTASAKLQLCGAYTEEALLCVLRARRLESFLKILRVQSYRALQRPGL